VAEPRNKGSHRQARCSRAQLVATHPRRLCRRAYGILPYSDLGFCCNRCPADIIRGYYPLPGTCRQSAPCTRLRAYCYQHPAPSGSMYPVTSLQLSTSRPPGSMYPVTGLWSSTSRPPGSMYPVTSLQLSTSPPGSMYPVTGLWSSTSRPPGSMHPVTSLRLSMSRIPWLHVPGYVPTAINVPPPGSVCWVRTRGGICVG